MSYQQPKSTTDQVLGMLQRVLHEGNVHHIVINDAQGNRVSSFPLTVAVIAVIIFPPLLALGIVLAILGHYSIGIEKTGTAG